VLIIAGLERKERLNRMRIRRAGVFGAFMGGATDTIMRVGPCGWVELNEVVTNRSFTRIIHTLLTMLGSLRLN